MRIEALRTLVAVVLVTAHLCPRLAAANNLTLSAPSSRKAKEYSSRGRISQWDTTARVETSKRPDGVLSYREIQNLLRREGGEDGSPVDCCPTVEELIEPLGGKNRENRYVDLYRDGDTKQVFYEYSCRSDVLGKPCRFLDRKLANQSRCVQKFSYTYALVQDNASKSNDEGDTNEEHGHRHGWTPVSVPPDLSTVGTLGINWNLDYIQVRSGCTCVVLPKRKKKKKKLVGASRNLKKTRNKW